MKNVVLIALLVFGISESNAQWVNSLFSDNQDIFVGNISNGKDKWVAIRSTEGKCYLSDDNGKTFSSINPALISSFQCVGDTLFAMYSTEIKRNILLTADKGASFDTIYIKDSNGNVIIDDNVNISFFYFWENGKALVLTTHNNKINSNSLFLSNDFGHSWVEVDAMNHPFKHDFTTVMRDIQVINDKIFLKSVNRLYSISNYGQNIDSIHLNSFRRFAFKDTLNGLFDLGNTIYRTTDGGKTLTVINKPPIYILSMSYAFSSLDSSLQPFYFTSGREGGYKSYDDGETWEFFSDDDYFFSYFSNVSFGVSTFYTQSKFRTFYFDRNLSAKKVENISKNFSVYPNPSKGSFIIELMEDASVQIYSTHGQSVYSSQLKEGQNAIDLGSLSSGVYFVKVYNNSVQQTQRIVIE